MTAFGARIGAYPSDKVFASVQPGHGFVPQSGSGTYSDDTSDFVKGIQSLKIVTNGTSGVSFSRRSNLPATDLRGKSLKVWVKVSDPENVAELSFYASSDALLNYYEWRLGAEAVNLLKPFTWTPVSLNFVSSTSNGSVTGPRSGAFKTGNPNRSSIVTFQWRVKDKGTAPVEAKLGGVSYFDQPSTGVVSLAFDDGWASQYTEARKKMDEYGMVGTAYIIPNTVGTPNYMTLDELKRLQDANGWNIAAHHESSFAGLTTSQAEERILDIKGFLVDNGFTKGSDDIAYPNGAWDEPILMPLFKKHFRSGRTIGQFTESLPPSDYHKLRIMTVNDTMPTATVAARVDEARLNGEWLILVFHKLVETPALSTEYSIANFGLVIDDIANDGIRVAGVCDILNDQTFFGRPFDSMSTRSLAWKEGANASFGTAVLLNGEVTVNTAKSTSTARIYVATQSLVGVSSPACVAVTARTPGVSFVISSASAMDASTVAWLIVEPF